MKRSIRRWLETTNATAAGADITVAPTIGASGTPPMNATTRTIAAITIAEPRSVCTRQVPAANAGEQQQRLEAAAHVGEVVLAAHEQVGGEHHDGELEELRRLHREARRRRSRPGRR